MLEGKGRLSRLRVVLRCGDARHNIPQACQRFIRGITDGTLRSQMLQRAPHLQNRAYLILAQHAALILHDGDKRGKVPLASVIRHESSLPRPHLQKALLGQLRQTAVHHGAAHLHLLGQFPLRRKLCTHGQLVGQYHPLQLLDKQVLQAGSGQLCKFHCVPPLLVLVIPHITF